MMMTKVRVWNISLFVVNFHPIKLSQLHWNGNKSDTDASSVMMMMTMMMMVMMMMMMMMMMMITNWKEKAGSKKTSRAEGALNISSTVGALVPSP